MSWPADEQESSWEHQQREADMRRLDAIEGAWFVVGMLVALSIACLHAVFA
jgi:hypothetical protein